MKDEETKGKCARTMNTTYNVHVDKVLYMREKIIEKYSILQIF